MADAERDFEREWGKIPRTDTPCRWCEQTPDDCGFPGGDVPPCWASRSDSKLLLFDRLAPCAYPLGDCLQTGDELRYLRKRVAALEAGKAVLLAELRALRARAWETSES